MKLVKGVNDFETLYPDMAKEWDYDNNDGKTPDQFTRGSTKSINWICAKGHRWPAVISSRTLQNSGCPFCNNKKVLKGFNDLETTHPELAKEWDFDNNDGKTPDQYTRGSTHSANWICARGHRWPAHISDRTAKNSGCPYCANKKVLKGFNDFKTCHPDIAEDWDYGKNAKNPDQYIKGARAKVFWCCHLCGYRWPARISDRVNSGSGCPGCDNRVPIPGVNDFATFYPDLIKEWDFENNDGKSPEQYTKNSGEYINWKCGICGHRWSASIHNRTSHNSGCPRCADKVLILGQNDLLSQRPDLIKEWDFESNTEKTPDQYRKSTHEKVGWVCKKCGYKWSASIHHRVVNHSDCPRCAGQKATQHRKVV